MKPITYQTYLAARRKLEKAEREFAKIAAQYVKTEDFLIRGGFVTKGGKLARKYKLRVAKS